MAPKGGTVASKIDFSRFRENGISIPEFFGMASYPVGISFSMPNLVALRSAVWPAGPEQTNKQTNKPGGEADLCLSGNGWHGGEAVKQAA